ncbi:Uncharacterised protein [Mycobacterium tuberculosis]|nr:Uncharacterised protein [Mycobacterium tuberculosis]
MGADGQAGIEDLVFQIGGHPFRARGSERLLATLHAQPP